MFRRFASLTSGGGPCISRKEGEVILKLQINKNHVARNTVGAAMVILIIKKNTFLNRCSIGIFFRVCLFFF